MQLDQEQSNQSGLGFFKNNISLIKKIILVFFLSAIIIAGYRVNSKINSNKYSEMLHQSMIHEQLSELDKSEELLKKIYESSAPSEIKSLAGIRYASYLVRSNKLSQAGEIYSQINKCFGCDRYIKDFSGLLAVKTWLSDSEEVKKSDLPKRIEAIESSSKILKYQITEQRGLLALKNNNLEVAYKIFESIINSEASQNLKYKAQDMMLMINEKGYQPKSTETKALK
jgi:hypothetical protein